MREFTIVKVEKAGDKSPDKAPSAQYVWEIRTPAGGSVLSGFTYVQVMQLMLYFAVDDPADLAGAKFLAPNTIESFNATSALDWFLRNVEADGKYRAPSGEDVLNEAIEKLAKMQRPEFPHVDRATIFKTFLRFYGGSFELSDKALADLNRRLAKASDGQVRLDRATPEDFTSGVQGPSTCLRLVGPCQSIKVVFGPYSTPFMFVY